jgi:NADH-quinone oxidoreductase subunit H
LNICIFAIVLSVGTLSIYKIMEFQNNISLVFPLVPFLLISFVISLAEMNRAPFDLPEAEAELVAGYNVDYAAMNFAFFFLGEYTHIVLISFVVSKLFFGGINSILIPLFFIFLIVQVRAALPRYRYDQLIKLG